MRERERDNHQIYIIFLCYGLKPIHLLCDVFVHLFCCYADDLYTNNRAHISKPVKIIKILLQKQKQFQQFYVVIKMLHVQVFCSEKNPFFEHVSRPNRVKYLIVNDSMGMVWNDNKIKLSTQYCGQNKQRTTQHHHCHHQIDVYACDVRERKRERCQC